MDSASSEYKQVIFKSLLDYTKLSRSPRSIKGWTVVYHTAFCCKQGIAGDVGEAVPRRTISEVPAALQGGGQVWKQDEYEDIIIDCIEMVMSFSTGFLGSKRKDQ